RSATVSVVDLRAAALISNILLKAGLTLRPVNGHGPGTSDLWVTEPTARALSAALALPKGHAAPAIVLLGVPPTKSQRKWASLGAKIIDPPDDFAVIRRVLGAASIRT